MSSPTWPQAAGASSVICTQASSAVSFAGTTSPTTTLTTTMVTTVTTVTMVVTMAYCLNDKTKMTVAAHTRYMASWVLVTSDDDIVSV